MKAAGFNMQFLSISQKRSGVSDDSFASLRDEETQQARALYLAGHLRQVWHRGDVPGACLVWEADSEEQVRGLLSTLPFAQAGLLEITIVPLKPYAGFGPR